MATTHATTSAAGLEGADEAFIASLRAGLEGADEAFTSPICVATFFSALRLDELW